MFAAWGEPPWTTRIDLPRTLPPKRVDAAVIGAGLTGLAAARELAEAGLSVAVLEAGTVGVGASGRTGGIVLEGAAGGALEGISDCLPALARRVREEGIDCDLRLHGCFELVHDEPGTQTPHPIAWRDGERVLRVAREIEGGTLDPLALLAGILRGALAAGARVCEQARVTRLDCAPNPVLYLEGHRLACDRVLVALNAWTHDLVPEAVGLRPALALALATEPVTDRVLEAIGLGTQRPFYTVDLPYLWGRILPGGGLLFGAGLVFVQPSGLAELDLDRSQPAEFLTWLEGRVRGLHPALAEIGVAARWGGPVCFRPGAVPVLTAHPNSPRAVIAGAFAGHGVALSLRAGELAAQALLGRGSLPDWGALQTG